MSKPDQLQARLVGFGMGIIDMLAHVDDAFLSSVPGDKGGTSVLTAAQLADTIARLPEKPLAVPGGACANTIAGVARLLGGNAALLAPAGDDSYGQLLRDSLASDGVDMSRCPVLPGGRTGVCLSLVTPDAERTMRSFRGVNDDMDASMVNAATLAGGTHFYIEGYLFETPDVAIQAIETAHAAGLAVCMDFNSQEIVRQRRDMMADVLKTHVTAIFANEQEAAAFAGTDDMAAALARLSDCCPVAVVKLGSRGSLVKARGGDVLQIPSVPARAIDTTGAGDLWAAGFFAAWLTGKSLCDAGLFGSRVAAEVVQVDGAHLPEQTWKKLGTYL